MVTYAKISSKMVNPGDIAGNTEEEEEKGLNPESFSQNNPLSVFGVVCFRL